LTRISELLLKLVPVRVTSVPAAAVKDWFVIAGIGLLTVKYAAVEAVVAEEGGMVSADCRRFPLLSSPPDTSTLPSFRAVAAAYARGEDISQEGEKIPVAAS
jgi:hypothetical protein